VKDIKIFNLSLFAKWRWRLLAENNPLWKLVLKAKYGFVGRSVLAIARLNKASLWWRDLVGLGVVSGVVGDWMKNIFIHNIGDECDTIFWHHHWCALGSLAYAFPRLFRISLQPEAFIKAMGVWVSGSWIWNLKWRRPFFSWEEDLYRELIRLLEVVPISRVSPSWSYRYGIDGQYSVKDNYAYLSSLWALPTLLSSPLCGAIHKVWESWAPSKVVVFLWQALLLRIPTRSNLATRGVVFVGEHMSCAVCGGGLETEDHLFLMCPLAWSIWVEVYRWFGVVEVFPGSIHSLFVGFLSSLNRGKKLRKGIMMVWHAVM
jgi:hypothetical protein